MNYMYKIDISSNITVTLLHLTFELSIKLQTSQLHNNLFNLMKYSKTRLFNLDFIYLSAV